MLFNRIAFKSLIRTHISSSRWYNTKNMKSLYVKIKPLGYPNLNVTPELDKWVETGNKVRFTELHRIIVDLRKNKRYTHALQCTPAQCETSERNWVLELDHILDGYLGGKMEIYASDLAFGTVSKVGKVGIAPLSVAVKAPQALANLGASLTALHPVKI